MKWCRYIRKIRGRDLCKCWVHNYIKEVNGLFPLSISDTTTETLFKELDKMGDDFKQSSSSVLMDLVAINKEGKEEPVGLKPDKVPELPLTSIDDLIKFETKKFPIHIFLPHAFERS